MVLSEQLNARVLEVRRHDDVDAGEARRRNDHEVGRRRLDVAAHDGADGRVARRDDAVNSAAELELRAEDEGLDAVGDDVRLRARG